jgi:hypothetical protein
MKTWLRRDEWVELALCTDSAVHTAENPSEVETLIAEQICSECLVRPECIEWAIRERASAVFVAGVYLPDPGEKRELKLTYNRLQKSLANERELRGPVV